MSIINAVLESPMDSQDVFTQLYQSLTPDMATQDPQTVFDEWLKQDFLSEYSANSSPEINTPLDPFLMSPPYVEVAKPTPVTETSTQAIFDGIDLDVSALLNSPIKMPEELSAAVVSNHLFADIDARPKVSPAVVSATTPTFSASPAKRKEEIDPSDEAALKRQKNTDAARRSRLRKVQKMETLELRVTELERMNAGLLMRVAVLDSEKTNLKAKESSFENRIKVLEDQLAEAHKALSSRV